MTPDIPPGELLLLASSHLHRVQTELLQRMEIPLTLRQFHILQQVDQGHTSLSDLSRLVHRSLPTVSESVDGLLRRKLVVRRTSPTDRRAAELSLTPQGRTALELGAAKLSAIAEDFLASLPKTQRATLQPALRRMYAYANDLLGWTPPTST
jgi:MarR family transcriptional regulator, organic hydroperoxide resistance regulator